MFYFSWSYQGIERYATRCWLPDVDPPDGGRTMAQQVVPTLDGEAITIAQGRDGMADQRMPGRFTLSWNEMSDPLFRSIAEEDFARGRQVSVRFDSRWRQLEVTSSGASDRKVTVARGYLNHTDGDTYWLTADTVVTCAISDTLIYATPSAGALTIGHGVAVPAGSVKLADITVAANVVAVQVPSGVPNARTCNILECEQRQNPGGQTALRIVLQEVR